jgi:hypothetical protein
MRFSEIVMAAASQGGGSAAVFAKTANITESPAGTFTKTGGTDWEEGIYSLSSRSGARRLAVRPSQLGGVFLGLVASGAPVVPGYLATWGGYCHPDGNFYLWGDGAGIGTAGAYAPGDLCEIRIDGGGNVNLWINGVKGGLADRASGQASGYGQAIFNTDTSALSGAEWTA